MITRFILSNISKNVQLAIFIVLCPLIAQADVVDMGASQDTYVNQRRSNNSYGSSSTLKVKSASNRNIESLLQFDMSGFSSTDQIQNATLKLYVNRLRGSNNSLSAYAVLSSWSESTSWENKPTRASSPEDGVKISKSRQYYEWDVTQLVQDWIDGTETNNGIALVAQGGYIKINSSERGSKNPILTITYTPESILEEPVAEVPDSPTAEVLDLPVEEDAGVNIIGIPNDAGVSDAPIYPANKRIVIVAQDGSGDYRYIQDALNSSQPGDTIQVKNGVYVERVNIKKSGTRDLPIAVVNYPGHKPVIDPGGGSYPPSCCPSGGTPRVEFNAEWIILEGFEIRYGWDGVKIYEGHNTIRNNWIHNNRYQGILVVSVGDVFIEGNKIHNNGTDPDACYSNSWGGVSPKHCHGIYMSDYHCTGLPNITLRGNFINDHGGMGIQWNGYGCSSNMDNNLVENNILENNSWGIAMYFNVENGVFRNNTFILESYPETNATSHVFIGVWGSKNNVFENNIFYSTRNDITAIEMHDETSSQNNFNYNLWKVQNDWWVWEGAWRSDFDQKYKSDTGWGASSWFSNVDPEFVNITDGDYRLTANSPARDTGDNEVCASHDFDYVQRVQGQNCDMGAFEFNDF